MTYLRLKEKIQEIPKVNPDSVQIHLFSHSCSYQTNKRKKLRASLEFSHNNKNYTLITEEHQIPNNIIKEIEEIISKPYKYMNLLKIMEKKDELDENKESRVRWQSG